MAVAPAQDVGKLDTEAAVEQSMQRDERNSVRDYVSTGRSVSTHAFTDARGESNVGAESMQFGGCSSQSNSKQAPLFPNMPFNDYQLKQLRAQCLVFLAFRCEFPLIKIVRIYDGWYSLYSGCTFMLSSILG